jgi:ABC-type multidrug transport system fused ATPase/permease subunit
VGRTGAGKSTMCLVLSRIIELESGTISIDGVEASKVSLEKLREKITVIPQDPVIFDGTLKFNLDPTGTIDDKIIESILLEAGLDDLLKRTPEKKHKKDI